MSSSKSFSYQESGLSYTVSFREVEGQFFADITVDEGFMDVNAVYLGDSDASGPSESLKGPLNMNGGGAQFQGEKVQWDQAVELSKPGLKGQGSDKETFVEAGETFTVDLPITSLDEIDFFGIRATSTSTPEGSIKAVSGHPKTPDEPEHPEEPEEPKEPKEPKEPEEPGDDATYDKVFFAITTAPSNGYFISANGDPEDTIVLPEDAEGTFEDYVNAFFDSGAAGNAKGEISEVVFYRIDDGDIIELESPRLESPEGGFETPEDFIEAYNDAITPGSEGGPESGDADAAWFASLMTAPVDESQEVAEWDDPEEDEILIL